LAPYARNLTLRHASGRRDPAPVLGPPGHLRRPPGDERRVGQAGAWPPGCATPTGADAAGEAKTVFGSYW
jgi:hypothetical protein